MMSNATKIQITRDWFVEEFFKDANILANWKNGRLIIETTSKYLPYVEITIKPMTKETGDQQIINILDEVQSYEEHQRNRFITKLMRERGK
jgi:hypothetical protein